MPPSFFNKESLRIAHIADLHFSKFTLSPMQFFSKRVLGNTNLLFFRKRRFRPTKLKNFASFLQDLGVNMVIICGDFSTTAREIEFGYSFDFVKEIQEKNIAVLKIPGNHDHYTKSAWKKRLFYDYLDNSEIDGLFPFTLRKNCIEVKKIGKQMYWIGLDTAKTTPFLSAFGIFSTDIEEKLKIILNELPKDALVLLSNHFPLMPIHGKPNHSLLRSHALCTLLQKFPQKKIYLHGHSHKHAICDLRKQNLPLTFDSGSVSDIKHGSFNLLDISDMHCTLQTFSRKRDDIDNWDVKTRYDFLLK